MNPPSVLRTGGVGDSGCRVGAQQCHREASEAGTGCDSAERQNSEYHTEYQPNQSRRRDYQQAGRRSQKGQFTLTKQYLLVKKRIKKKYVLMSLISFHHHRLHITASNVFNSFVF